MLSYFTRINLNLASRKKWTDKKCLLFFNWFLFFVECQIHRNESWFWSTLFEKQKKHILPLLWLTKKKKHAIQITYGQILFFWKKTDIIKIWKSILKTNPQLQKWCSINYCVNLFNSFDPIIDETRCNIAQRIFLR